MSLKWRERRGLSWICSTLTEFRLKKLCFCRLNLFAIRICSLRSLHPSANPPNSQNTLLATINSAIKKSHTRWLLLMAGTTRLVLDLLHAHRVSPKKALLLPAQSVRYPDLFTTFTPSVRKSAELAKYASRHYQFSH